MPEAHSDQWAPIIGVRAAERLERPNPSVVFVYAISAACDQPAVAHSRLDRQLTIEHGHGMEREAGFGPLQQALEYDREVAMARSQAAHEATRFHDSDPHSCFNFAPRWTMVRSNVDRWYGPRARDGELEMTHPRERAVSYLHPTSKMTGYTVLLAPSNDDSLGCGDCREGQGLGRSSDRPDKLPWQISAAHECARLRDRPGSSVGYLG